MSAFILNTSSMSIVGYITSADVNNYDGAGAETRVVEEAGDLEDLSLQQLTDLYNSIGKIVQGETFTPATKFKVAKAQAIAKVMEQLGKVQIEQMILLDPKQEEVLEEQVKEVEQKQADEVLAAEPGKKVRKVRDSKLQRMKAAFLTKEESGEFKQWTVKELMEKCGTSERITHVYISILRSPSDRFVLNIEKVPGADGAPPSFMLKPKEPRNPRHQVEDTTPPAEQA